MIIILFLLLFVPGILCQWINGQYRTDSWLNLCKTFFQIIVNDFIILAGIAVLLYIVYGDIVYSFSTQYSFDSSLTIFHVEFIAKYAALDVIAASCLGIFERIGIKLYKRIRYKK